ncbi:MAG: helix-turn-helix transcriptional regulator [Opitutales bacterium]|nr:helix-turn-helix transcriptional regulator [Opitutales bacterium]
MRVENFDIAQRARQLRLRVKISQEEFAEYAAINYKFYQQIESGRRSHLRVETVARICAAYGIELWEFFHPNAPNVSIDSKKIISSAAHNTRRRGRPRK